MDHQVERNKFFPFGTRTPPLHYKCECYNVEEELRTWLDDIAELERQEIFDKEEGLELADKDNDHWSIGISRSEGLTKVGRNSMQALHMNAEVLYL